LCERSLRSRVNRAERGQVELLGETPNGLSAGVTFAKGDRECQYDFCEPALRGAETRITFHGHTPPCSRVWTLAVSKTRSAFHPHARFRAAQSPTALLALARR